MSSAVIYLSPLIIDCLLCAVRSIFQSPLIFKWQALDAALYAVKIVGSFYKVQYDHIRRDVVACV